MLINKTHIRNISRQMTHVLWSLMLAVISLGFVACNHDDTVNYTEYYDWRDKNMEIFNKIDEYKKQDSAATYFNHIVWSLKEPLWASFYHVVHAANLDSLAALSPRKDYHPYSTSTLKAHYTLFDTESVYEKMEKLGITEQTLRNPGGCMDSIFFANAEDNVLKADTIESNQVTFLSDFTPNSVITGWGDILQQMYIGDHVVACIPWFLAYGQAGSTNIDPYSNLFFRIELCDITNWGGTEGNQNQ